MEFQKLDQTRFRSKSSIIADQILQMIRNGELNAGEKLHPERIIAEQLGVSRPSVREAISALQIVGILETRPGDGTYVTRSSARDELTQQAMSVLEESDSPYEILQARKALELGVIRLAIEMASDDDLLKIKEAWSAKSEKGKTGEYEAYSMRGKEFHLSIAKATKNRLIENIMDKLLDAMNQPLWVNMRRVYYEADDSRIEEMLKVHDDIVAAILRRDTEKAIQSLEVDFDIVLKQLYYQND